MLNAKSNFLAVDCGAGSLKLAEFEVNEAGGLVLKQYAIKSLGLEGSLEAKREALILKTLQEVIAERGISAKELNICAPGFHVFSKFVKLPPVEDASKVSKIVEFEARSNVPFPLEEVVWDYQILGTTANNELEVLLVAIKSDIVEGLFRMAEANGLRLQVCDVSPAALCNAFRFNYGDLDDCTMLLDIGAKTSNLLFFEKGKVFSRSINLGANAISQDFANESKLKFDAAEKLKVDEGFVSLGGAYEEPENPNQAAIAKIARQFMTRLHIQVNQTLQFYRGQQGGSAPQRLFLAGGASIMPYTAQFFAEKLNVPVEYFNPFRNVQIDPGVNLEELARSAHAMGEVVGLGLRNLATCPVELNLMPESTLRWQSFNQKKPYFIGTLVLLVVMGFLVGLLFKKLAGVKEEQQQKLEAELAPSRSKDATFTKVYGEMKKTREELDQVSVWAHERYYWAEILSECRAALIRAEGMERKKMGVETGVWIEKMTSATPAGSGGMFGGESGGAPGAMAGGPVGNTGGMDAESAAAAAAFRARYGMDRGGRGMGMMPGGPAAPPPVATQTADPLAANSNQVAMITLDCRAVSLAKLAPGANVPDTDIAYAVEKELKESALFDGEKTAVSAQISTPDEVTKTFTFTITVALKTPIKL